MCVFLSQPINFLPPFYVFHILCIYYLYRYPPHSFNNQKWINHDLTEKHKKRKSTSPLPLYRPTPPNLNLRALLYSPWCSLYTQPSLPPTPQPPFWGVEITSYSRISTTFWLRMVFSYLRRPPPSPPASNPYLEFSDFVTMINPPPRDPPPTHKTRNIIYKFAYMSFEYGDRGGGVLCGNLMFRRVFWVANERGRMFRGRWESFFSEQVYYTIALLRSSPKAQVP